MTEEGSAASLRSFPHLSNTASISAAIPAAAAAAAAASKEAAAAEDAVEGMTAEEAEVAACYRCRPGAPCCLHDDTH